MSYQDNLNPLFAGTNDKEFGDLPSSLQAAHDCSAELDYGLGGAQTLGLSPRPLVCRTADTALLAEKATHLPTTLCASAFPRRSRETSLPPRHENPNDASQCRLCRPRIMSELAASTAIPHSSSPERLSSCTLRRTAGSSYCLASR